METCVDRPPRTTLISVVVGNALEFYDFFTFSFFALQIGHAFFPTAEASRGLLFSLATFGIGFLTRPLGGIILGFHGDRVGRRPAMVLSMSLIGVSTVGLALTPDYAQIGPAAPIALLAFRLLQGFALGGEVGAATAFLVESAPAQRRGFYVALQATTQGLAILAAGVVGVTLSMFLSKPLFDSLGWRLAFLLGAAVVPVGLYLRRALPETLHLTRDDISPGGPPRLSARMVVLCLLVLGSSTITTYVRSYVTTFAQNTLMLSADLAFGATVVNGLCGVVICPFAGILSDRRGRRPIMFWALGISIILSLPAFLLMQYFPTLVCVYVGVALLSAAGWSLSTVALVMVTEFLPKHVRSVALGTTYAVAIAVFGGTTQFLIQLFIDVTGSAMAPAWYNILALVMGAVATIGIPESAPAKCVRVRDHECDSAIVS